jgi:hypothetical protein
MPNVRRECSVCFQWPHWTRAILAVLTFFLGTEALAQQVVLRPQEISAARLPDSQSSMVPVKGAKPGILDRKFFLLAGVATAATVLDVATTAHCISNYANCREANPLFGPDPSKAKLYGLSFSILAGQILASAWLRRKIPHSKLWMIPPIAATAGHGTAAAFNFHTMHELRTSGVQ